MEEPKKPQIGLMTRSKVFRVRKQLTRMVQTAADVLSEGLEDKVREWPSLNHLPIFDQAMVDASVGCDLYRHHLSMLTWGPNRSGKLPTKT